MSDAEDGIRYQRWKQSEERKEARTQAEADALEKRTKNAIREFMADERTRQSAARDLIGRLREGRSNPFARDHHLDKLLHGEISGKVEYVDPEELEYIYKLLRED